jgi:phage terminase large subunit
MRAVCVREVQKDLSQSVKALLESKLSKYGLNEADGFKAFKNEIKTPGDGIIIFKGMQDYNADSVKSLEGFKIAWWEEAHGATKRSMNLLHPTIRMPGSEIWYSWNAQRKIDPVDQWFKGPERPSSYRHVTANWRDNPWFSPELEQERQDCMRMQPEQYEHIWEGKYVTVVEGAYFARQLVEARAQKRIGIVPIDPLMTVRLYMDIGGTGAHADTFAIWAVQFIGLQVRVVDYYEAQGQPMAAHVAWLRQKGYTPDRAQVWLPHDGAQQDKVIAVSYESAFKSAGYTVTVVPNQGKGAAAARIEAVRNLFPAIWINEPTCEDGLAALGWYHARKDDKRGTDLGPEHDWASHGADAFGLMAVTYKPPKPQGPPIVVRPHRNPMGF